MGKKILHVVNISYVIPYYLGGQIQYFQQKGHHISIACTPSAHFFSLTKKMHFTPISLQVARSFSIFKDLQSIVLLYSKIKKHKFNTVVGHTPKGAFIAMLASYMCRVPNRVYFRHGLLYETSTGVKRRFLKFIERFTARLATKVICVSPSVLKIALQEKLSKAHKTILIHKGTCNGVDALAHFNPLLIKTNKKNVKVLNTNFPTHTKIIGFVGRVVKDKGVVALLEAWKILIKQNKNIHLLIIGPQEERNAIPKHCLAFAKDCPSISLLGLTSNIAAYYKWMDIFVLPSYREGFPTVALEASAMKLPVICSSKTGCIDAIIAHKTGLYTPITPDGIAKNIQYLLDYPQVGKEMGKAGRAHVIKNFKPQLIWEFLEKIY